MTCPTCGAAFAVADAECSETTLGYFSPPGHEHNPNPLRREFTCAAGHAVVLSMRQPCNVPGCEWDRDARGRFRSERWVDAWPPVDRVVTWEERVQQHAARLAKEAP